MTTNNDAQESCDFKRKDLETFKNYVTQWIHHRAFKIQGEDDLELT